MNLEKTRPYILLLLSISLVTNLYGQAISIQLNPLPTPTPISSFQEAAPIIPSITQRQTLTSTSAIPIAENNILPKFARQNPTGYTYLCRLELQLEKQMPVAIWLKLGEQNNAKITGNIHAQLKLKRF